MFKLAAFELRATKWEIFHSGIYGYSSFMGLGGTLFLLDGEAKRKIFQETLNVKWPFKFGERKGRAIGRILKFVTITDAFFFQILAIFVITKIQVFRKPPS